MTLPCKDGGGNIRQSWGQDPGHKEGKSKGIAEIRDHVKETIKNSREWKETVSLENEKPKNWQEKKVWAEAVNSWK